MGKASLARWLLVLTAGWISPMRAAEIPAGTLVEIRLLDTVVSPQADRGARVRGVVVAPVVVDGVIRIPAGAQARGSIRDARSTGWGFGRETALLWIEWDRLRLPGGEELSVATRIAELENARESADDEGRIRGIRSTGTMGYRASNLVGGLAVFDPIAYLFVNVASARMLRFTEPEIVLPRGAEMLVRLEEPVETQAVFAPAAGSVARNEEEIASLGNMVRSLPFRSFKPGGVPSDLVNVVLLGSGPALERAFRAAGWVQADELSATSVFLTFRSMAENQGYQAAPMSVLLLNEKPPDYELSKSLNTFAKRHHVRFWAGLGAWQGHEVFAGAATHDTGIIFSRRSRTFSHSIDPWIDDERNKILNDLLFTGCVIGYELVDRAWLPDAARRAGGMDMHTDGAVAVVLLNSCENPAHDFPAIEPGTIEAAGGRWKRGVRQGALIARNDLLRANLAWQAWEGGRWLARNLRKRPSPQRTERRSAGPAPGISWADEDAARPEPFAFPMRSNGRQPRDRWAPSLFELGAQGGRLRFGLPRLDPFRLEFFPQTGNGADPFTLDTASDLGSGWAAGITLTSNTFRYFSQELAFSYQRGKYDLFVNSEGPLPPDAGAETQRAGLLTRQFQYNWLIHATPRERRLRPYIAGGPVLQLVHLTDAPLERAGGVFRVGWRNIGLLKSAYNFRRDPPLDGGGIFQAGFQYGAGVKWRAHPRWVFRWDFRETVAAQPDIFSPSFAGDAPNAPAGYSVRLMRGGERRKLRQQRFTLGFAFTF